jgi:hypothetical protein
VEAGHLVSQPVSRGRRTPVVLVMDGSLANRARLGHKRVSDPTPLADAGHKRQKERARRGRPATPVPDLRDGVDHVDDPRNDDTIKRIVDTVARDLIQRRHRGIQSLDVGVRPLGGVGAVPASQKHGKMRAAKTPRASAHPPPRSPIAATFSSVEETSGSLVGRSPRTPQKALGSGHKGVGFCTHDSYSREVISFDSIWM